MPGRFPLSILVALGAGAWALVLAFSGSQLGWDFVKPFSLVVGVISIVLATFDRWLWRWPGIRDAVGRPDLEGTYLGEVRSEWVNPESGAKPAPIPAALVIKQAYTALTVTLFTGENESVTLAASLECAADERHAVVWMYRAEPRLAVRDRNSMHHGAARLNVAGAGRLNGSYWTDRKTQGEMEFSRVSTTRAADFTEARVLAQSAG